MIDNSVLNHSFMYIQILLTSFLHSFLPNLLSLMFRDDDAYDNPHKYPLDYKMNANALNLLLSSTHSHPTTPKYDVSRLLVCCDIPHTLLSSFSHCIVTTYYDIPTTPLLFYVPLLMFLDPVPTSRQLLFHTWMTPNPPLTYGHTIIHGYLHHVLL